MLPPFEIVDRLRPVDLIAPGRTRSDLSWGRGAAPATVSVEAASRAPYLTLLLDLDHLELAGRLEFGWELPGGGRLLGWYDGGRRLLGIDVVDATGRATRHRSRRHGRPPAGVSAVALVLTGTHLSVFSGQDDDWSARARVDLAGAVDTRLEELLAGLRAGYRWHPRHDDPAPVARFRQGSFGQLGLRDLHVATHADGAAVVHEGRIVLTATHAGPGFFDCGQTGVWGFDPASNELTPLATLWFRRPDRPGVFGDHASHLVRDGEQWLVATSTWGDFDRTSMSITLARTEADLLVGEHVLDTTLLPVPSSGVGVWDPHLARIDGLWWVGHVSATRFFDFHPALCRGDLDRLEPVAADLSRSATEGVVLAQIEGTWRLLASDGRGNPKGLRKRFPVYDLSLREVGALDAPYPTNIPWPMVFPDGDDWVLLTFDGTPYGGALLGYGTHGDVVVMRSSGSP